MQEISYRIRRPDGAEKTFYSPSTTIRDHLAEDQAYTIDAFLA